MAVGGVNYRALGVHRNAVSSRIDGILMIDTCCL